MDPNEYHYGCWLKCCNISQGSMKFSFTACHLGTLQLACTRVKVIFASSNYISTSRIDYSSSVMLILQNTSLLCRASKRQNVQAHSKIQQSWFLICKGSFFSTKRQNGGGSQELYERLEKYFKEQLKLGSKVKDIIIYTMKLTGTCKFLCTEKRCLPFKLVLLHYVERS